MEVRTYGRGRDRFRISTSFVVKGRRDGVDVKTCGLVSVVLVDLTDHFYFREYGVGIKSPNIPSSHPEFRRKIVPVTPYNFR